LLEQGENATPVVKDFLGTVAANIQVVGNFGDTPFLNEVAQDTRDYLFEAGLRAGHPQSRASTDTDAFKWCGNTTVLHG